MSVINTNVKSLIAQDSLRANNNKLATAMERLSTGSKVNSAKDDAAGLAIGTRMTSQVRGLNMAIKNANDGINLAQTAEGAMTEVTDMLQRMRELAVQAGNSTNTDTDRAAMNDELTQLKSEIDRVAKTTQFNNMNILDGSFAGKLQIGNNANQTMDLAIGAVDTKTLGETTHGAALAATTAKVQVSGAAQTAAAYQGASFGVTVNGVTRTVTLPPAADVTVNTSGAKAAVSFNKPDASIDNQSSGQVGGVKERLFDVSTAAKGSVQIKLNNGDLTNVDISDSNYYVDSAQATGTEIVAALQSELDKTAAFQGANKLTVSLDNGRLNIALASGAQGTLSLKDTTGTHTLLSALKGSAVNATLSTDSGSYTVGAKTVDISTHKAFDIGANHFDLSASIASHGFDATKLTGEQFVTAYNETAKVGGVNVSTASLDEKGILTFSGADPVAPSVGSPYTSSGSLVTTIAITANTHTDVASFLDTGGTSKVGQYATTITAGTNDTLTLAVNGGQEASVSLAAGTYNTMSDIASEVQSKLNALGAFSGANAVSVTAVQDDQNKWGLQFKNTNGYNIDVSGTFLTGTGAAQNTGLAGTLEASTNVAGSVTDNSTDHVITVHGPSFPPSVNGNGKLTNRTVDLHTAADAKFSVSLYGGAKVDLDLAAAIADHSDWDNTKLTGAQLVTALNETFAADGHFAGDNAITASLTADGQLQFAIKQVNPPVGSTAPIIQFADTTSDPADGGPLDGLAAGSNFITKIGGLNSNTAPATGVSSNGVGVLSLAGAPSDAERFGYNDLTVTAGTNDALQVTVGANGNPVNLTLEAGVYTDADALINNINKQIRDSGAFTGSNALTVTKVLDADGNQGFNITSATGQAVTVGGSLISHTTGFHVTTNDNTVTFPVPGAKIGGVDLSGGDDVTMSVAKSDGTLVTKSFNIGNTGAHVSFSDYASALQSAANTAFADSGVTFTASSSNGQLSFNADQTSAGSLTMTGGGVAAAFGADVTGVADKTVQTGSRFTSMDAVVSAINDDLSGLAKASYDTANKTWSFEAEGAGGTSSTIALSGAGLSTVQFGGTLSANGGAGDATASKLADVNVLTTAASTAALGSIDNSIEYVSKQRSLLGAIQNRLEHTVNNLTNIVTNTEASRSAIMDADYSKETTALAKSQILTQAATAMLAQANQSSQGVLSLLK